MFQLSPSPIHPVPRGDLCHLGLGCGWVVGLGCGWVLTTSCATSLPIMHTALGYAWVQPVWSGRADGKCVTHLVPAGPSTPGIS